MCKFRLIIGAALTLAVAHAYAQDNQAYIFQLGEELEAQITQTGSAHYAEIRQSGFWDQHVLRNVASTDQTGELNRSTVHQPGSEHTAQTIQEGRGNEALITAGAYGLSGGLATITQSGDANQAFVDSGGESSEVSVHQVGAQNLARISQSFANAGVVASQEGISNSVSVNQSVDEGGAGWVTVSQLGDGHLADVIQYSYSKGAVVDFLQVGSGHHAEILQSVFYEAERGLAVLSQNGTDHSAGITQEGGNDAFVTQYGDGHLAMAGQRGEYNTITIRQSGSTNVAWSIQDADWEVAQYNSSLIEQDGDLNRADLIQRRASYADAAIYQTGSNHEAVIMQRSQGSQAIVTQLGAFNLATINQ